MNTDVAVGDGTDGPDGWHALAGVAAGYGLACALIFVAFFVLPFLLLAAL
ncbi:hypothetical protein [Halorubrum sp. JWXQ-INN 858]|nr:hypothetical protein [Halorubrum sp. JWXQ-INN 858]